MSCKQHQTGQRQNSTQQSLVNMYTGYSIFNSAARLKIPQSTLLTTAMHSPVSGSSPNALSSELSYNCNGFENNVMSAWSEQGWLIQFLGLSLPCQQFWVTEMATGTDLNIALSMSLHPDCQHARIQARERNREKMMPCLQHQGNNDAILFPVLSLWCQQCHVRDANQR